MSRILCLLIMTVVGLVQAQTIWLGGFDYGDAQDSLTMVYLKKSISDNLNEAKIVAEYDKKPQLDLLYGKHGNIFLAAREIESEYAKKAGVKIDRVSIKDPNFAKNLKMPDYFVFGAFKSKQNRVELYLEIYSSSQRTTIAKPIIEGRKNKLLDFYNQVNRQILTSIGSVNRPNNSLAFENEADFTDFLRFSELARKKNFEQLYDELESVPDLMDKYSDYAALFNYAKANYNFTKPSVLGNIVDKTVKTPITTDENATNFAKKIISNGYRLKHKSDVINEAKDTSKVDVMVYYQFFLKKREHDRLWQEMKVRKGDNRFADMGRNFFSANEEDNKAFIDVLKEQVVVLAAYDSSNVLLFESKISLSATNFEGGGYRHSDSQPFPIMPLGPADNAFKIKKETDGVFVFEKIDKKKVKEVKYLNLELRFE